MRRTTLLVLVLALIISWISGAANAKLVACLGDSNTYGYGIADREDNCYPAQLERLLRQVDARWETRNFGVGGASVLTQSDTPYVQTGAYDEALVSEPNVVIFAFGTNASRLPNRPYIQESYVSDYTNLIDDFAKLPSEPEMWVCYPLKAFSTSYSISDEIIRDQIIPLMGQIASEKNIGTIDFYTAFDDSPNLYTPDGIHPHAGGARLMAELVAAELVPVRSSPDLTMDGKVDFEDISELVRHWLESAMSFDVSPPPNGDGIVDSRDFAGLASYWLEEPSLVAHWALDETEGTIARDSAGEIDGVLYGHPTWRPAGGRLHGALELDGVDDYIDVPFVLDPGDGPLSVFAWIKGGGAGQVIICQSDRAGTGKVWLGADSSDGRLMTALTHGGDGALPLVSESVITDGEWHRVGFASDGSSRALCVDGIEVAKDVLPNLIHSNGTVRIGWSGKTSEPGSFFSGRIDDVRIYNQAVTPRY
ncbi:MAG: hypothetical protein JSU70_16820 [Phycisphaerales bacterium]|nr:MAG: hypothetical protein JSU70_16820 [Phycisphaerales bacterium]